MSYLTLPVLIPIIAAPLIALAGRRSSRAVSRLSMLCTAVTFVVTVALFIVVLRDGSAGGSGDLVVPHVVALGLSFNIHGLHGIFACVASYMWLMTTLYSDEYMAHSRHLPRYYLFLLLSYGATVGVFLANDLFTSFVFFEIMSMTSYFCIAHNADPAAIRAGNVYLAVVIIGGMVTLMGLFLLYDLTGTLYFAELRKLCAAILTAGGSEAARLRAAAICILVGYGSKAGLFPLHIWLPLAHPVAPAPASALLSGIITKTGVFGLIAMAAYFFPGDEWYGMILVVFGTVTMLHGGIIALFSTDIKRTLACSSISQLGMIVFGIGMQVLLGSESAIGIRGAIAHMFSHSNLKLVLFMSAGVIAMDIHKLGLNDIRGYGRNKNLLKAVFLIGALGIAGVPMFNGYISKTVLHESVVEYIEMLEHGLISGVAGLSAGTAASLFHVIEWLFLLTGGFTVAYMTKLFICVFVERNSDPEVQKKYDSNSHYMSGLTAAVLVFSAAVLPVLGLRPHQTMDRIADLGQRILLGSEPYTAAAEHSEHVIHYFGWECVSGALISIVIGACLYLLSRKFLMEPSAGRSEAASRYADKWPQRLDLITLLYEPLFIEGIPKGFAAVFSRVDVVADRFFHFLRVTVFRDLEERKVKRIRREQAMFLSGVVPSSYGDGLINTDGIDDEDSMRELALANRFSRQMIMATAAYSLLLFGLGLIIVVIYVLAL